jgi:hypothetical protein
MVQGASTEAWPGTGPRGNTTSSRDEGRPRLPMTARSRQRVLSHMSTDDERRELVRLVTYLMSVTARRRSRTLRSRSSMPAYSIRM